MVVIVAATAACSGSSGAKTSAADVAAARRINLAMADFPAGWRQEPPAPKNPELTKQVLTCLHAENIEKNRTADISSPTFTQPGPSGTAGLAASSEITFKSKSADAVKDYVSISTVQAGGCVQTALRSLVERVLAGRAQSVSVDAGSVQPPPTAGNPGVGFSAKATAKINGQETSVAQGTVAVFFRGRKEMVVTSLGLGEQSFPPDLFTNLVSVVADRANAAKR